jgi:hypothetical protein
MVANRTVRLAVAGVVLVSAVVAAFMYLRLRDTARVLRNEVTVIRRPGITRTRQTATKVAGAKVENIAPFATVTASSVGESDRQAGGVADGDAGDDDAWLAASDAPGAWIKLTWDLPASISAIELYDLPNPSDNVLAGSLQFDDGETIPVPALPPNGTAWRTNFAPKAVRSVTFRIDRSQGRQTGLAEIMVYGVVSK